MGFFYLSLWSNVVSLSYQSLESTFDDVSRENSIKNFVSNREMIEKCQC